MKILCFLCFITSIYSHKTYSTECAVEVNIPAEVTDSIFERFVRDFQHSPDALFDWALYGTGVQDDEEKTPSSWSIRKRCISPKIITEGLKWMW